MKRKNKVLAALAIGAAVILIGSSIARCSIAAGVDSAQTEASSEAKAAPAVEESRGSDPDADDGDVTAFGAFRNSKWASHDKASELMLTDAAMIESVEGASRVIYYAVESEDGDPDGVSVVLSVSDTMAGEERRTVMRIANDGLGGHTLTCDELHSAYEYIAPEATEVSIQNSAEELTRCLGHTADDIEAALSRFASERSPHAASATWDGELWIDCNAGTVVTNFILDDAASTVVSVMKTESGELVAS